jgi:hypothetical protein
MSTFSMMIEELMAGFQGDLPKLVTTDLTKGGKRNINNNGKVAGKYFKGFDNTSKSMISQRDREASEEKGQVKSTLQDASQSQVVVMDKAKFDDMLNTSGGRTMDLTDGKPKSLNSKTANYEAQILPDGRVKITKLAK